MQDDFRANKTIEFGWRMSDVDPSKKTRRNIAYGLSEIGFLEHLEDVCDTNRILGALLYERDGSLKLVDENINDHSDPRFEHTCGTLCSGMSSPL